jgi:Fic family protein
MSINSVSKKTAIKDLKDLENDGFLESKKMGRQLYYFGSKKIKKYFVQK